MNQKIAVALIHGVGNQGPEFADAMTSELYEAFAALLPADDKSVHDKITIRPVYWADILARKERILWNILKHEDGLALNTLRNFMMNFVGDATAYQPGRSRREIYERIHTRIASVLHELAEEAGPEAPLCVIGHSLGTVITHNFFFDLGDILAEAPEQLSSLSPCETGQTLALFYTMGSPLALWSMRYDNYIPIPFPGALLAERYPQLKPQWINYYDKDDVLAYPIRAISRGHFQLAKDGLLKDVQVNVGNLFRSWNPLSHMAYWQDKDVVKPVARSLFEAWQAANVPIEKL